MATTYHTRPSTLLGLRPDDPEWQWAAYQLDVATLEAGIREDNERMKKARKKGGKGGGRNVPPSEATPATPDVLRSLMKKTTP